MATKKVVNKKTPLSKKAPSGPARRKRPARRKKGTIQDLVTLLAQQAADRAIDVTQLKKESALRLKEIQLSKKRRFEEQKYLMEDMPEVLPIGAKAYSSYNGELIGGEIVNINVHETFFGPVLVINLKVIAHSRTGIVNFATTTLRFKSWADPLPVNELPIKVMTDDVYARLTARGEKFRECTKKPSYMNYTNELYIPSWYGWMPVSGVGRVAVDGQGMRIMMPNVLDCMTSDFRSLTDDDESERQITIDNDQLYMTVPYVPVFSFRQKRWLAGKVDNLSSIEFNVDVFNQLVLDADKKFIVKSLVEHSGTGFSDIVGGKSGGFVFLLHGPPGVGKTLTAEATAETLSRPLYMVSVGELGTSPEELETKLSNILEVADRWNAVLLLDEADIFLEQRTDHDMERNAMVGIFLRLLEYFNGVLFLTTNRVKNFDKAFHSRISLAINYDEMSTSTRRQIWSNLLTAAHIDNIDLDLLESMPLNGRQIKNSIRLAQTIAIAKKTVVDEKMLILMSQYTEEFITSLNTENV